MKTVAHAAPAYDASPFADPARQSAAARLGMWVFIATELVFFGPLFLAYSYGRLHWAHPFALASRHTDVILGTLNTGILLSSSALVALAVAAAKDDARALLRKLLWATVALGVVFLLIKAFEYHADWHESLVPGKHFRSDESNTGGELFFFLYFVMTGLHALHILIGISVLGLFASTAQSRPDFATPERIEIAALYWHFVDVIWIFLYPLLYLVERHA